jgi:hypothetical protein
MILILGHGRQAGRAFNKIVVILDQNPLITAKQNDFIKWKTVLLMISERKHLTLEGFEQISKVVKKQ